MPVADVEEPGALALDPPGLRKGLTLGQYRLRQEAYWMVREPHSSHREENPPSAAVRQSIMARAARNCGFDTGCSRR